MPACAQPRWTVPACCACLGQGAQSKLAAGRAGAGAGLGRLRRRGGLRDAAVCDRQSRRPPLGEARPGAAAAVYLRTQPGHLLHVLDVLRLGRAGQRARRRIPGDLSRPDHRLPVRNAAYQAHDRAGESGKDHVDRRFPGGPLRQELRGRLDRHGHRHAGHDPLHRAAVEGDIGFGRIDGAALQRGRRRPRYGRRRPVVGDRDVAGAVRGAFRHTPCRRHRAPGRSGAGDRRRVRSSSSPLSWRSAWRSPSFSRTIPPGLSGRCAHIRTSLPRCNTAPRCRPGWSPRR